MVAFKLRQVCLFSLLAVFVTQSGSSSAEAQQVMLLDFSTQGCMPCRQMEPIVARLQREGLPVRKVDAGARPDLASRFRVDRFPTFVLVSGGREVSRIVGMTSEQQLRQMLASVPRQAVAVQPRQPQTRSGVVPATFAEATAGEDQTVQVGEDLVPVPAVTIPGQPQARPSQTRPAQAHPAQQAAVAPPTPNWPRQPRGPATAQPATAQQAAVNLPASLQLQDQMLRSSVRLKVDDPQGSSFGTGTIIDAREGEALILTCGHLFHDQQGKLIPSTTIMVEMFEPTATGVRVVERVPGQVISSDYGRDVALVSIRPRGQVTAARVAPSPAAAVIGGQVWSVGCDRGADPTVRSSQIRTLDKYTNPASLSATGAPVVGRSGGGLFNTAGQLVGVCFAADQEADEGLYAKLQSVHAELDELGLTEIYRSTAPARGPPARPSGGSPPASLASASATQGMGGMVPVNRSAAVVNGWPQQPPRQLPVVRGQDAYTQPAATLPAGLTDSDRAALTELGRLASESEVVCVVRPKHAGGKSDVITIDKASPAFLEALRSMRGGTAAR